MEYNDYSVVWPPRPERAFPPSRLNIYSTMGDQSAQVKMNGTSTVIYVKPDRSLIFKTRHNTDHKIWTPKPDLVKPFYDLAGTGWYVFVAELLHSKVTGGPRDVLYLHEIIVKDGEYLIGTTFAERQRILYETFLGKVTAEQVVSPFGEPFLPFGRAAETTLSHHVLDSHVWLARNYTGDFAALFKALDKPEHEGLVLKSFNARLEPCSRQSANSTWQTKSRRVEGNQNYAC
jgi:hypothetical protein